MRQMKFFKFIGLLLITTTLSINPLKSNAQVTEVAGWKIEGMGMEENKIRKMDTNILGILFIQKGQTIFSIFDIDAKTNLLTVQIECLHFDQVVARNNNYIGMKSSIKALGEFKKSGWLYLQVNKIDDSFDVIHLDLTDEKLIFVGSLLDENMMNRLSKLSAAGVVLKNGGKLKVPLEQFISEDNKGS